MSRRAPAAVREVEAAPFSDRFLAFTVDYALFGMGFFASMKLAAPQHAVLVNPGGLRWACAWSFLFLLYQAWFSSEGRRTMGKHLLELRVVSLDGDPLGLGYASIRAAGYLLSSPFCLGFLWMRLNSARQCWHDMLVGSVVVREHAPLPSRQAALKLAAAAGVLLFASIWTWQQVIAETYYGTLAVGHAHVGLRELDLLERLHHDRFGRYADSVEALARLSGDPAQFTRDIETLFDPVRVKLLDRGYRIEARARDAARTPLSLEGP